MKCKLYDITNADIIGLGHPIRVESNVRSMYNNAFRIVRKAYHRNRELTLAINGTVSVVLASIPQIGIVVWMNKKAVWVNGDCG